MLGAIRIARGRNIKGIIGKSRRKLYQKLRSK